MKKTKIKIELEFSDLEIDTLDHFSTEIKMNVVEYIKFKCKNFLQLELTKMRHEKQKQLMKERKKKNLKSGTEPEIIDNDPF